MKHRGGVQLHNAYSKARPIQNKVNNTSSWVRNEDFSSAYYIIELNTKLKTQFVEFFIS